MSKVVSSERESPIKEIMAAFEREPKIDLHHYPITVEFGAGILTLEGKTKDIAAKKLALEIGAAVAPVAGIVDRLKVAAAEPMTDEVISLHVENALIQEPALSDCGIRLRVGDEAEAIREPPTGSRCAVEINVKGGDVLLEGQVPSLSHKRLAGVLAWWVPGTENVLNCLIVEPAEQDTDDEIVDALRLVLEKDPFVNADQIRVGAKDRIVTLDGLVSDKTESEMAEHDAWYVFGVDKVVNRLEVQSLGFFLTS
jgi:osmotically-inducible protein OsmY